MCWGAQLACNVFEIVGDGWEAVGLGLYLAAARLNHSCVPNCAAVFAGRTLLVHTLRPVAADEEVPQKGWAKRESARELVCMRVCALPWV
jgi:hypothetical protein